jgi:hypothetical protein
MKAAPETSRGEGLFGVVICQVLKRRPISRHSNSQTSMCSFRCGR